LLALLSEQLQLPLRWELLGERLELAVVELFREVRAQGDYLPLLLIVFARVQLVVLVGLLLAEFSLAQLALGVLQVLLQRVEGLHRTPLLAQKLQLLHRKLPQHLPLLHNFLLPRLFVEAKYGRGLLEGIFLVDLLKGLHTLSFVQAEHVQGSLAMLQRDFNLAFASREFY